MCLLLKMKRPVRTRSMKKGLHKELGSSDRSGKPEKLSENTRVDQTHDGTGQPDERNNSNAHTMKEQFAPEENRDIASFNTNNEFNRAINEEDIDFNIPRLPYSAVLIQKIENPHRHALLIKAAGVLERRHRPLNERALLARWNGGEQEIRQLHS